MHITVVIDERYDLAISCKYLLDCPRRTQRAAEFESLGRIEQLDGKHSFRILNHSNEFGGGIRTHAHMILLPLRRRDGISRGRHAEALALADD